MNHNVTEWYKSPPCCQSNNLYMVLIAHNKAVLFVMQLDMDCVSKAHIYKKNISRGLSKTCRF